MRVLLAIAAALFASSVSAAPFDGLSCWDAVYFEDFRSATIRETGTLSDARQPDATIQDLQCPYHGTDSVIVDPNHTRGKWFMMRGNNEFLSVHSCNPGSDYPVEVYIYESPNECPRSGSYMGTCLEVSVGNGNCYADPRQACAWVHTDPNFWYYIFVTSTDNSRFVDFDVTFESSMQDFDICGGHGFNIMSFDEQCAVDLGMHFDQSVLGPLDIKQGVCFDNVQQGVTGAPRPGEEIDCRGTDAEIDDYKNKCVAIEDRSSYHEVCDYTVPETTLSGIDFKVKRRECVPHTCVGDFQHQIAVAGGSASCTTAGLSPAVIAGIAVGAFAFILCIAGASFCVKKQLRRSGDHYSGM